MKKKISLNILLSYPVYWSEYKVLRDFVQNFYDAKGSGKWWRDFSYAYDDGKLVMELNNSTFSYEWLLHIGASSKTGRKGVAGYFGEGFKIAALCAIRDWNWKVSMCSGNWSLTVIIEDILIDGLEKQGLAYEIAEEEEKDGTILVLEGVSEDQFRIFEGVLKSFFYPENPLLEQKLYEDGEAAVYTRSELPLPKWLPVTAEYGTQGIVFGRFQALGTVPFPLAIAFHSYHQKDRERNSLYDFDVIGLIYRIASRIDAPTAKIVLIHLRRSWNAYPTQNIDIHTWYYVICELIRRIAASDEVSQEFRNEFPDLLYGERLLDNDVSLSNRRRLAKAWLRTSEKKYTVVQGNFKLLGIPELEAVCEESGGFTRDDKPRGCETDYIEILKEMAEEILGSLFLDYKQTEYKIIRNDEAAWSGKAEVQKRKSVLTNIYGLRIKDRLISISIKEKYLSKSTFEAAVSIYFHELSHMFGGDASMGFSLALTYVTELLLKHDHAVAVYRKKWEDVCC